VLQWCKLKLLPFEKVPSPFPIIRRPGCGGTLVRPVPDRRQPMQRVGMVRTSKARGSLASHPSRLSPYDCSNVFSTSSSRRC
jgi:hypothetical protein